MKVNEWEEVTAEALTVKWEELQTKWRAWRCRSAFHVWRQRMVETAIGEMRARGLEVDESWTDDSYPGGGAGDVRDDTERPSLTRLIHSYSRRLQMIAGDRSDAKTVIY